MAYHEATLFLFPDPARDRDHLVTRAAQVVETVSFDVEPPSLVEVYINDYYIVDVDRKMFVDVEVREFNSAGPYIARIGRVGVGVSSFDTVRLNWSLGKPIQVDSNNVRWRH